MYYSDALLSDLNTAEHQHHHSSDPFDIQSGPRLCPPREFGDFISFRACPLDSSSENAAICPSPHALEAIFSYGGGEGIFSVVRISASSYVIVVPYIFAARMTSSLCVQGLPCTRAWSCGF